MNRLLIRDPSSRGRVAPLTARALMNDESAPKTRAIAGSRRDAISDNYRRYYVEMIEDIAAWLKGAQTSKPL
jgi:hypothetical protein